MREKTQVSTSEETQSTSVKRVTMAVRKQTKSCGSTAAAWASALSPPRALLSSQALEAVAL